MWHLWKESGQYATVFQKEFEGGTCDKSAWAAAIQSGPPLFILILILALTCDCCPATQAILLHRCLAAGCAGSLRGRPAPHTRKTAASREDSCEGRASR